MKRFLLQTKDSRTTDSRFASSLLPAPARRSRFYLRAERGYLAASHRIDGPPIKVIPTPEGATAFVDLITAVRRAQALHLLGWRELRVVEHSTPLM